MTSTAQTMMIHDNDKWKKHPFDQRLVQLSSSALAENLRHSCPSEENPPDQVMVDQWMQQIRLEIRRRRDNLNKSDDDHTAATNDSCFSSEDDLIQAARQAGLRQWQEDKESFLPTLRTSSSSKTSQFSLLSGGALASFMTWDRIVEESQGDVQVQLQMLLQVDHLPDLLPDWQEHVAPFFQQQSSDTQFCQLHRTWFDASRSSTEFRNLQIDLAQQVVDRVNQQASLPCIELALDMFTDWMLRGLYVHDHQVWNMGCTMYKNWLDDSVKLDLMIQTDNQATWFSAWTAHLSPNQVVELVSQSDGLSHALQQCQSHLSSPLDDKEQHVVCCYWLTILRSILNVTRVSRFPWGILGQGTIQDHKMLVLDLYLKLLQVQSRQPMDKLDICCGDAIETMLWGCHLDDAQLFATMMTKVEQHSDKVPLLQNILARLQRV